MYTVNSDPWTIESSKHMLYQPSPELLNALADGNLDTAQSLSPYTLSVFLVTKCRPVWKLRRNQLAQKPNDRPWVTRLLVDTTTNIAVGRAGFHGGPDENGMVEIGYEVDPKYRRQGRARDATAIMVDVARRQGMNVVRASIAPTNDASTNLVKGFGFKQNGEQWDEEDGLEIIHELNVRSTE